MQPLAAAGLARPLRAFRRSWVLRCAHRRLSIRLNRRLDLASVRFAIKKPSAGEGFLMAHSAGFELTTF